MSNIDRAADVIDQWTQEGHELNSAVGSPHAIAKRLAEVGLLAPDLPEPTTIAEGGRGATWGRDVQVWVEDGSDRVWVEMGDMTISYTIESARKHGNRLLAAANHAEKEK